jgi:hypothetical protein
MAALHDAILAAVVAEVEARTEWDEYPELYRLLVTGGTPRLAAVPFPASVWTMMPRPPDVLAFLAQTAAAGRTRLPGGAADLHGMAFRHEGWRVDVEPDDERAQAEVNAAALDHTLHTHPDRREERIMCAVDRAGITYKVEQLRGEPATGAIVYPGGGGDHDITGSVPESLDLMVAALTGIPGRTRLTVDEIPAWLKGHRQ